jgi:hypothetical protein
MGVQLRPFSVYHAMLLSHFDSPFLDGGASADSDDLLLALLLLCDGVEDGLKAYKLYHSSRWAKLIWFMRFAKIKFPAIQHEIDKMRKHIDTYVTIPEVYTSGSKAGDSDIPWPFKVASTLIRVFGFSEQDAWNMGVARAASYRVAYAEDNGVKIVNEDPNSVEAQHRRWIAAENSEDFATLNEYLEWERLNG